MKTPEEILTNHFGSSQVDGYRANIIDAMLYYASQQLKTQADNHRKDMAMKLDLLRQQHEAEMVELINWIGHVYWSYDERLKMFEGDNDCHSPKEVLAQFRSK